MKITSIRKFISIVILVLTISISSFGQQAYAISDVVYDRQSGRALGISQTVLDYTAAFYYDPQVIGTLYEEQERIAVHIFDSRTNDFSATALTRGYSSNRENMPYGLYSDHFVTAYYNFPSTVPAENEQGGAARQDIKKWDDVFGFSVFGASLDMGWYNFRGSKWREDFNDTSTYFLGTTTRASLTSNK